MLAKFVALLKYLKAQLKLYVTHMLLLVTWGVVVHIQDQALAECADIAEGTTAAHAARRADVFADETGRLGWTPLAGFLVEELREFAGGLGAALLAMTGPSVLSVCVHAC